MSQNPSAGGNVAKQTLAAVNLDLAIKMRVRGAHWNEIADKCGYSSPAAALKAVGSAMSKAVARAEETADQLRDTASMRLEALLSEAWDMIESQSVMDEDGNIMDDRPVRLKAVTTAQRIVAEKAKLDGLYQNLKGAEDQDRIIIIGLDPEDVV